ncbi:microtubule-actin cross-linking factor 1, isoforms 6/7-like isoform X2 [Babylonia areolata]|uniref:microtubule-actin cross-linking factor 1, isoforms 6/7-like isoform X2 n=1 Tax=Babylonia areolata TaxID=304850 RepID=UPI003FD5A752
MDDDDSGGDYPLYSRSSHLSSSNVSSSGSSGNNKDGVARPGRVSEAINSLLEWLQRAEETLADDVPVLGDLDTVNMLIEQHRNVQQELSVREPTVSTLKMSDTLSHPQHEQLSALWDRVSYLSQVRENKLTDALKLAEEFQEVVTIMREFLPEAEAQLKLRSLPDDEAIIVQMIEKHEKFEEELKNHQEHVDKIKNLAEEILSSCHPNAVRFVKYYLTITQTRWDQLLERAQMRGEKLKETQQRLITLAESLEEMLTQLTEYQALLATKEADPVPHDIKVVDELLKEHQEVYAELVKLSEAEDFMKIMSTEAKATPSPSQKNGSNLRLNEVGRGNPRYIALQNKWRTVSRMAVERKKVLQDAYDMLEELENFKNFDFECWRGKYLKWIQAKKFRITDFFRRQDKDGDGFLTQEEFVNGMLQSRFPTNQTELNAVFDIFDREKRGLIEYKDFVDALKPDKFRSSSRALSDEEVIQDSIDQEANACSCRGEQFTGYRVDKGKYRFGEKQKIALVRLLNKTVMVRVGGGWVPLEEFFLTNDPCRAGSVDSSLRKSRIGSSMINLSSNKPSSLHRNPEYGSVGNLSGQKSRTGKSSVSMSGRRTPSAAMERRRPLSATTPRATTPTVAFGSGVPRSLPSSFPSTPRHSNTTPQRHTNTTPQRHSNATPQRHGNSTPQRPSSATPTSSSQPVSDAPARQLGSTPVSRQRRLPTTPTTTRTPNATQFDFPDLKY